MSRTLYEVSLGKPSLMVWRPERRKVENLRFSSLRSVPKRSSIMSVKPRTFEFVLRLRKGCSVCGSMVSVEGDSMDSSAKIGRVKNNKIVKIAKIFISKSVGILRWRVMSITKIAEVLVAQTRVGVKALRNQILVAKGHFLPPFISTGRLPSPDHIRNLVNDTHKLYKSHAEGSVSQVYPALAAVNPDLFGISVVGTNGNFYEAGDSAHEFTMMSVSKPFVFALVCQELGPKVVKERLGVNATGLAFNSLAAVEQGYEGRTNPMVNSGAIATTSMVPGETREQKMKFIYDGLCKFAGRKLSLNEEVFKSASETNFRNQGIARLLQAYGRVYCDPALATDLYTEQCCLNVSAHDLAVMGATLADGGVNPITKEQVVDANVCHYVLAVMTTAGMYETSGDWLFEVGLPGKSGIGGGIVTVSPGKGGLGTFSPRLDSAGNSVRGQLVAKHLSQELGMDIFISQPEAKL